MKIAFYKRVREGEVRMKNNISFVRNRLSGVGDGISPIHRVLLNVKNKMRFKCGDGRVTGAQRVVSWRAALALADCSCPGRRSRDTRWSWCRLPRQPWSCLRFALNYSHLSTPVRPATSDNRIQTSLHIV